MNRLPPGGKAALSRALNIAPAYLYQLAHGIRPISAERCIDIERETAGAVCCEDLRSDIDWGVLRGGAVGACKERVSAGEGEAGIAPARPEAMAHQEKAA